ncbi:isoprenylcysteine carboxylmethyltransferase family protein [soil metagenome]
MKIAAILYGLIAYAVFLASFTYAVGFVGDLVVPKTIDSGPVEPLVPSLLIDTALLAIFAVQHSVMARPAFKAVWTRIVPPVIERSTYVLFSSLALALICRGWRPAPALVWDAGSGVLSTVILGLFVAGWVIVLLSTFLINHFDLFGLRQVWAYRRAGEEPPPEFRTPLFYRVVRHPLYLGFIIAFWAAPQMSVGRLFFAVVTTAYILIAVQFEEHDLTQVFGDSYRDYKKRVSMLVPLPRRS